MRVQTRIALMVGVVIAVAVAMMVAVNRSQGPDAADTPEERAALVRDDSHVLGEEGSEGVTFVEFLDFECESCRAAFEAVEDVRADYAGKVTFVVRYFPLEMHPHAREAARAAEAAARQGEFEAMYEKLFETQESWSDDDDVEETFRGFAEGLGLDLAQYDADYASSDVKDRVQRDVDDGETLGVRGTPTFFVDGEPVDRWSEDAFRDALDEALDR